MNNYTFIISVFLLIVSSFSVSAQQWALPHISVANVRSEPRHGAELSTQALMGHPVRLLSETDNDWWEVELPDGYKGYIIGNSLTVLDEKALNEWKHSDRVIVTAPYEVRLYVDSVGRTSVSDIVPGDILQASGDTSSERVEVKTPDGRQGWVNRYDAILLDKWASIVPSVDDAIDAGMALIGVPYLWGGLTPKGLDCSGLTKLAFLSQGVVLLRDASQQARTGESVPLDSLIRGDLVFFGNTDTGKVNHVAIYLGDGRILESSGRVRISSLSDKPDTLFARRIMPYVGSEGIQGIASHPWYF